MNQPNEAAQTSASGLRVVLFLVLAVLLAALGYDRLVARPTVEAAYKKVEQMINEQNAAKELDKRKGPSEVQELLGRAPVGGLQTDDGAQFEDYHWTAGLPWRNYNLLVFYHGQKNLRVASVFMNRTVEQAKLDVQPDPHPEEDADAPHVMPGPPTDPGLQPPGPRPDRTGDKDGPPQEVPPSEPAPKEPVPSEPAPKEPAPSEPATPEKKD